jgi:hypothetical protein
MDPQKNCLTSIKILLLKLWANTLQRKSLQILMVLVQEIWDRHQKCTKPMTCKKYSNTKSP